MRRQKLALAGVTATLVLGMSWAGYGQEQNQPPAEPPDGYLGQARLPDESIVLPPPPAEHSPADKADMAIFEATRAQSGSNRWQLAIRDDAADPAGLLGVFGCALGLRLEPGDAPNLDRLLRRAMADAFLVIGPPKDRYQRARPFLRADGETCIPVTPGLMGGGSYPSGHASVGWLYGLILGEIAPGQASELLGRARAYGESRAICGVHFQSDVEAGRTLASALVSVLHSDEQFRVDLAAAKAEIEALRSPPNIPDAAQCAIEGTVISTTPTF